MKTEINGIEYIEACLVYTTKSYNKVNNFIKQSRSIITDTQITESFWSSSHAVVKILCPTSQIDELIKIQAE